MTEHQTNEQPRAVPLPFVFVSIGVAALVVGAIGENQALSRQPYLPLLAVAALAIAYGLWKLDSRRRAVAIEEYLTVPWLWLYALASSGYWVGVSNALGAFMVLSALPLVVGARYYTGEPDSRVPKVVFYSHVVAAVIYFVLSLFFFWAAFFFGPWVAAFPIVPFVLHLRSAWFHSERSPSGDPREGFVQARR